MAWSGLGKGDKQRDAAEDLRVRQPFASREPAMLGERAPSERHDETRYEDRGHEREGTPAQRNELRRVASRSGSHAQQPTPPPCKQDEQADPQRLVVGLLPRCLLLENRRKGVERGTHEGLDDHDRRDVGVTESLTHALEEASREAESAREPMRVVHYGKQRGSHSTNPNRGASPGTIARYATRLRGGTRGPRERGSPARLRFAQGLAGIFSRPWAPQLAAAAAYPTLHAFHASC
jgi:hypothetical protein